MRAARLSWIALAGALTLLPLAGCGPEGDEEAARGATGQAAAAACTDADLTTDGICAGPWQYDMFNEGCHALAATAWCGVAEGGDPAHVPDEVAPETCHRMNRCRNSCNGNSLITQGLYEMRADYQPPSGGYSTPYVPGYDFIRYYTGSISTCPPPTSGAGTTSAYGKDFNAFCSGQAQAALQAAKNADPNNAAHYFVPSASTAGTPTAGAFNCAKRCPSEVACRCWQVCDSYGNNCHSVCDPNNTVYTYATNNCSFQVREYDYKYNIACGNSASPNYGAAEDFTCQMPSLKNGAALNPKCEYVKGVSRVGTPDACGRTGLDQQYTCDGVYAETSLDPAHSPTLPPFDPNYNAGTFRWRGQPKWTTKCRRLAHGEDVGGCGTRGLVLFTGFGTTRPTEKYADKNNAVCLTGDHQPTTWDRFQKLKYTYENAATYGAYNVDVARLRTLAVIKLKTLLEVKGNDPALDTLAPSGLTQRDELRSYVFRLYETRPDAQPSCGTSWTPPGGSFTRNVDFNDGTPLTVDQGEAANVTVVRQPQLDAPQDGTPYLRLGSPGAATNVTTARTDIGVPASGGTLTFWWRNVCPAQGTAPANGAAARLLDNTTQQSTSLLNVTCTPAGSWDKVVADLTPYAGHVVTLYLSNLSAAAGGYSQFDNLSFTTTPAPEDARLQACKRALGLDAAGATLLQEQCAEGGIVGALPLSYENRAAYVSAFRSDVMALFNKVQSRDLATSVGEGQVNAELQRRLALVDRWFQKASVDAGQPTGLYGEQGGTELLYLDVSKVALVTWEAIYARDHAAFKASPKASGNVQDYAYNMLARDRELLTALFSAYGETNKPPLTSAPALYFFADSFRGMLDRLNALAPYHDFGCRFADCRSNGIQTEITALYGMMATLHDPAALDAAVSQARTAANSANSAYFGANPTNWTRYLDLMTFVSANHATVVQPAVVAAAGAAAYRPSLVTGVPASGNPALVELSRLVQDARTHSDSFKSSGLLLRDGRRRLPTGLLSTRMGELDNDIASALANLHQQIVEYNSTESATVGTLLTQVDQNIQQNDIEARWRALGDRAQSLAEDDAALKVGGAIDRIRFADYTSKMLEYNDDPAVADKLVSLGDTRTVQFRGNDGRYLGESFDAITTVAKMGGPGYPANGVVASGSAGDIVTMNVEGVYQPTCAINAKLSSGGFYGIPTDTNGLSTATTNSTGFSLTYSGQKYNVTSVSDTTTDSVFVSVQACAGGGWGIGWTAKVEACAGYSHTETHAESEGSGTQGSSTAAFSLGLRLPNTPFPQFPAGALLAVQMRKGGIFYPSDVLDVQVVGEPRASIVLQQDADVYLVVNDLGCGAPSQQALTVVVSQFTPASNQMRQVASAIANLGDPNARSGTPGRAFQDRVNVLLAQGALLPNDIGSLKDDSWQALRISCSFCDVDAFPGIMKGFFENWVDGQIRHIERRIQQRQITRELNQVLLENESLKRDLSMLEGRGRLVDLLPRLSIRNLEYSNEKLNPAVVKLRELVAEQLYPMAYLRYPEALTNLSKPKELLKLDWVRESLGDTNVGTSLAGKVENAVIEIKNRLDTANSLARNIVETDVVLRFPNPWHPPEDIADEYTDYPGKKADPARSREVWSAILDGLSGCSRDPLSQQLLCPKLRFAILPSDLYKSGVTNGSLGCDLVSPSIVSMGFFLASTDEGSAGTKNSAQSLVPVTVTPDMLFATSRGLEAFLLDNDDWTQTSKAKIMYGRGDDPSRWREVYDQLVRDYPLDFTQAVSGVSPFTDYTVDSLEDKGDPWYLVSKDPSPYTYVSPNTGLSSQRTTDFMVIMRIEARQQAGGVTGVVSCPRR